MSEKIAYYLRLSQEDGDLDSAEKVESNSIQNQRSLIENHLGNMGISISNKDEYIDDGYTGTNFNRPGFKRLLEEAKAGLISTIVVKDFSRLGRDYIEVANYIDQIFPVLGVRFISVNDNFDSGDYLEQTMGVDHAIHNMINTMYSKDSSKKIKSIFRSNWEQGKAMSARTSYGYAIDPDNKGHWIIDPEAAKCVRMIFDLALQGKKRSQIAAELNKMGMPTPSVYFKQRFSWAKDIKWGKCEQQLWTREKVGNILRNYQYTGALTVGKSINQLGKDRRAILVGRSDWVIVENTHEAIVTKEEYQLVNKPHDHEHIMEIHEHPPLFHKILCGNCRLQMRKKRRDPSKYQCTYSKRTGVDTGCFEGVILEKELNNVVLQTINLTFRIFKIKAKALQEKFEPAEGDGTDKNREKQKLQNELAYENLMNTLLYEKYVAGKISLNQFKRDRLEQERIIQRCEKALKDYQKKQEELQKLLKESSEIIEKYGDVEEFTELTKDLADQLVENVFVYDDKHIEVVLKTDRFQEKMKLFLEK